MLVSIVRYKLCRKTHCFSCGSVKYVTEQRGKEHEYSKSIAG